MGDLVQDMMQADAGFAKKMAEFTAAMQEEPACDLQARVPESYRRRDLFNELSISAIEPIVDLQLEQVRDRQTRHITLDVTPAAERGHRRLRSGVQRPSAENASSSARWSTASPKRVITGELRDRSRLIDIDAEGNYACPRGPHGPETAWCLDDPSFLTAGADPGKRCRIWIL